MDCVHTALQASSQGGSISKSRKPSPLGCQRHALLRARHGQDGLQGNALDHLTDISDLGSWLDHGPLNKGSRAIIGARWVLNIPFFPPGVPLTSICRLQMVILPVQARCYTRLLIFLTEMENGPNKCFLAIVC